MGDVAAEFVEAVVFAGFAVRCARQKGFDALGLVVPFFEGAIGDEEEGAAGVRHGLGVGGLDV